MRQFIKCTSSSKDNPSLLIYDNHESHISLPVLDLAKENGVTVLTLHPHCSHKMQPLDVSIYGPFKTYYAAAMDSLMMTKPGVPITICDFGKLVNSAHQRAMTPTNIISCFKIMGIFPYDDGIFQDDDFAACYVTDRPDPTPTSLTPASIQTTAALTSCSSNAFVSPQEMKGYPKAQPRKETGQGRKKRKSMIATDTPEKDELLQANKKIVKLPCRQIFANKPSAIESSSSSEDELQLSDHSSDDLDEENIFGIKGLPPISEPLVVGNYVLVEFETTPKTYYVGLVTKTFDENDDCEVSYLRRKEKSLSFSFPAAEDVALVKLSDVKIILNRSAISGTTKRQHSNLQFDYNFDNIIIK